MQQRVLSVFGEEAAILQNIVVYTPEVLNIIPGHHGGPDWDLWIASIVSPFTFRRLIVRKKDINI